MAGYDYSEPVKNEKGVWYHTVFQGCPVCGREWVYRTRRPGPAPRRDDYAARYSYDIYYDYCDVM